MKLTILAISETGEPVTSLQIEVPDDFDSTGLAGELEGYLQSVIARDGEMPTGDCGCDCGGACQGGLEAPQDAMLDSVKEDDEEPSPEDEQTPNADDVDIEVEPADDAEVEIEVADVDDLDDAEEDQIVLAVIKRFYDDEEVEIKIGDVSELYVEDLTKGDGFVQFKLIDKIYKISGIPSDGKVPLEIAYEDEIYTIAFELVETTDSEFAATIAKADLETAEEIEDESEIEGEPELEV